eukprot:TRINITY_DN3244_c4_g1_i2.p1 TRINITY_DN3244_c4_g1~~TRINITY_DN3244_c4_g1_i2.p1  ORF type:complete len:836 (-),score=234.38 TRINITY_DN3244_c4_g1_i2:7-2487(-)
MSGHEVENVRVVVRIKPVTSDELDIGLSSIIELDGQVLSLCPPPDVEPVTIAPMTPKATKPGPPTTPKANKTRDAVPTTPSKSSTPFTSNKPETKRFAFDKIYDPNATQKEVFQDVEPFIDAAVNGYNSTIFCYGQTGSGKTHTMMGPAKSPGIIHRTFRRIFEVVESRPNTMFIIQLTFVELHLDTFIDLLDPINAPSQKSRRLPSMKPKKIEIHEDAKTKSVYITGSETIRTPITSLDQAMALIKKGIQSRTVGSTAMNSESSRSHSILTIHIESRDQTSDGPVHMGKLHLVDLAGSERLSRSLAEGMAQKETQNINSSLSALGDVLAALSSKSYNGPIPYRNSKLTRLLQDSLGGNSKTFFIVNIQATAPNYQETLMSLMYGQRAKKIKNITFLNKDLENSSDIESLQQQLLLLRNSLISRTKEFEAIKRNDACKTEENQQLKEQLAVLSQITEAEIARLEMQLNDVIHGRNGELAQVSAQCSQLQRSMEAYRQEKRELQIKLHISQDEAQELKEKKEFAETELEVLRCDLEVTLQHRHQLEIELKSIKSREGSLTSQLHLMEKAQEQDRLSLSHRTSLDKSKDSKIAELEEAMAKLEESIADKCKEVKDKERHISKLTKERDTYKDKAHKYKHLYQQSQQAQDTTLKAHAALQKQHQEEIEREAEREKEKEKEREREREKEKEVEREKEKENSKSKRKSKEKVEESPPKKQKRGRRKSIDQDTDPKPVKEPSKKTSRKKVPSPDVSPIAKSDDNEKKGKRRFYSAASLNESMESNVSASTTIRAPTSHLRKLFEMPGKLQIPRMKTFASSANKENESNMYIK